MQRGKAVVKAKLLLVHLALVLELSFVQSLKAREENRLTVYKVVDENQNAK